jgi:hypothetical protein
MTPYRHLERRIDRLLARAARDVDARLLAEMEDALATGYAYALAGDARSGRLRRRLDALAGEITGEGAAAEVRRLALEQRALEDSTRELRSRLAVLRERFSAVGAADRSR